MKTRALFTIARKARSGAQFGAAKDMNLIIEPGSSCKLHYHMPQQNGPTK